MTAQLSFCCQKDLDPLNQCKWIHCRHPKNPSNKYLTLQKKDNYFQRDGQWLQHPPHHPHNLRPEPESRNHHYSFHEYQLHVAGGHQIHWPREPVISLFKKVIIITYFIVLFILFFFNKQVTSNHICMTNLNSELPLGANRDTWDGAIVIGGNDGALLSSTNTGHSLKRGRGTHYFYL